MTGKAYNYLNTDRLHHIDMLETLDRNEGEILYSADDGVMVLSRPSGTYMLSTESADTLEKMCALIGRPAVMTVHQARFVQQLRARYAYKYTMACLQCAYLSKERLDEKLSDGISVRLLTQAERAFVLKHYEHGAGDQYIAERIEAGMLGVFCEGKPAGFIGTHAEGAMGILEVLPDFRRRGLAYSLEAALINHQLMQGFVPHAHILANNKPSILLQEKLGLSFSDKTLSWLFDE